MQRKIARAIVPAVLGALLQACGGGGSDTPSTPPVTTLKGRFVDSPVSGLAYTCTQGGATVSSGQTTLLGEYDYVTGSTCTFKIGGITLGSTTAAAIITPVSLVPGATSETDPTVNNIVRLLMSLDADNDATNGIVIDSTVAAALASNATVKVTDAPATFASLAATAVSSAISGRTLVTAAQASNSFGAQLLGLLAGNFACSFTGAVTGTATITIAAGSITGTGTPTSPAGPSFGLSGQVASSGSALISGNTSGGASFTGTFTIDGTGSGSWSDGIATGTWTCNRG